GGGVDLTARGPRDPLHLAADLGEELLRPSVPAQRRAQSGLLFAVVVLVDRHASLPRWRLRRLLGLAGSSVRPWPPGIRRPEPDEVAGQEGLDPPTPGFGDRYSTN